MLRRAERLAATAHDRLHTGLVAGDPDAHTALAWSVSQDSRGLHQLDYPELPRQRADELIADLRGAPIPELARPDRTPRACRPEFLAHFDHPAVNNGPTESLT